LAKMRKLMLFCAMALIMMVVAAPQALAQSYWDPAWVGSTSDPVGNTVVGNNGSSGEQGFNAVNSTTGSFDSDGIEID